MDFRDELKLGTSESWKSTGHSQEEATDPFSTPHLSKDGIPYESDVELMDETSFTFDDHDLAEVEYGHSVRVTGPSLFSDDDDDDKQEIAVSMGSVACIRSLEDPMSWHGEMQGDPTLCYLKQDDQGLYHTDLLDSNTMNSDAMRVGFAIHQTIDPYLNGSISIHCDDSTKSIETFETTVGIFQEKVDSLLNDMPESIVLIRCDLPYFENLICGSKAIVRHVVVEYFRSPWKPLWKHRVRSALVRDTGPWYETFAGERYEAFPDDSPIEKEDVAFPDESFAQVEDEAFFDDTLLDDSLLNEYEALLLQTATTPLFDLPSDDWIAIDTQPLPTLDGPKHITPGQPVTLPNPSGGCHSLNQVQPFVKPADLTTASMDPEGDIDSSSESKDTNDSDYSFTESIDSDTDEDGDNRSLPNVIETFYHERSEDHSDICPETDSIASNTSNNNGSSSSIAVLSGEVYQLTLPDPNTCKPATNLKGIRLARTKSKPSGATLSKLARKVETKRPRIFECRIPGCANVYTTQYSLDSHTNSQHGDINYQCLFCNKTYSRYGDCTRHEDTKHRMKRWKCKWCPQKYTRKPSTKQQEGCLNGRHRHSFKIIFLNPYAGLSYGLEQG